MTAVATPAPALADKDLGLMFQYTVEAYKSFEKLAENLPNPMTAATFKQFALDERDIRNMLELKGISTERGQVRVTLGADSIFNELIEGELSFRESAEFLIARERTMQKKLRELIGSAAASDRNLLVYIETIKRAHVVELERELELLRTDADWWKREDAEWRMVHGAPPA